MSLFELGKPAPADKLAMRDAAHVPVICVTAHAELKPGEPVCVTKDGTSTCSCFSSDVSGIVDPFRTSYVCEGEACLVLLRPGSVEDVRHEWSHEGLNERPRVDEAARRESMRKKLGEVLQEKPWDEYLSELARKIGTDTAAIMYAAEDVQDTGSAGYQNGGVIDTSKVDWNEFWTRYERHTGNKARARIDPFCC